MPVYKHDGYEMVQAECLDSLDCWAQRAVPTGDFLKAVLSNDLRESFGRADDYNRAVLFDIVRYCYNELPFGCWGSPDKVLSWRGLPLVTSREARDADL